MYEGYETAPDGTYVETRQGLARVDASSGYWVGLQTNTRAGRKAQFIGIWTAPDGEKFVDPSRWVATLNDALKLAIVHFIAEHWYAFNLHPSNALIRSAPSLLSFIF